jgi:hypothetical protein
VAAAAGGGGEQSGPRLIRLLPLVVLATLVVAVLPMLTVWELHSLGILQSCLDRSLGTLTAS